MRTHIESYDNAYSMANHKVAMMHDGWTVVDTVKENGGYGCTAVILGLIFLPLFLLGKKNDRWIVTYSKPDEIKTSTLIASGEVIQTQNESEK